MAAPDGRRVVFRSHYLRFAVVLLLFGLRCLAEDAPPESETAQTANVQRVLEDGKKKIIFAKEPGTVIKLDARSFDKSVRDGNRWLIEIYAPWCSHCTSFAPTYQDIARHFAQTKQNVKVAKIDGDGEMALASRFGVHSFPSFYLIDGYSVYEFDESRTKQKLIDFAEHKYKEQAPMAFYASPMGPVGLIQGFFVSSGMTLGDLFAWFQATWGFSPLVAGGLLFGAAFMSIFVTIVFLAIVVTPKAKED